MKDRGKLFDFQDNEPDWKNEWKDMPEFVQEDLTSYRKIVVHFRNDEDVKKFAELIGQKITQKKPSLWFPEMLPRRYAHLRYVDNDK
jgi:hypothetical protein